MDNLQKRKISESEETKSEGSCVVVPYLGNVNHTMAESDSDSCTNKGKAKLLRNFKKQKPNKEEYNSTDSSVEIVDVTLPYQELVEEKQKIPTQELDTIDLWDRLVSRHEDESCQRDYDAE